jgi:hypothetical protein
VTSILSAPSRKRGEGMRRVIFTAAAAAASITLAACANSTPSQPAAGGSKGTSAASSAPAPLGLRSGALEERSRGRGRH